MGFLAYVMDMWVTAVRPSSISEVPIVCEFAYVFPEDFSGAPP